ncbi:hypothetical protein BDZ97DRAFT_1773996 [Flammula alnicola]|nr:hypothetical protein BDZ97DRAFT_1773996 [Flammula alnicola]
MHQKTALTCLVLLFTRTPGFIAQASPQPRIESHPMKGSSYLAAVLTLASLLALLFVAKLIYLSRRRRRPNLMTRTNQTILVSQSRWYDNLSTSSVVEKLADTRSGRSGFLVGLFGSPSWETRCSNIVETVSSQMSFIHIYPSISSRRRSNGRSTIIPDKYTRRSSMGGTRNFDVSGEESNVRKTCGLSWELSTPSPALTSNNGLPLVLENGIELDHYSWRLGFPPGSQPISQHSSVLYADDLFRTSGDETPPGSPMSVATATPASDIISPERALLLPRRHRRPHIPTPHPSYLESPLPLNRRSTPQISQSPQDLKPDCNSTQFGDDVIPGLDITPQSFFPCSSSARHGVLESSQDQDGFFHSTYDISTTLPAPYTSSCRDTSKFHFSVSPKKSKDDHSWKSYVENPHIAISYCYSDDAQSNADANIEASPTFSSLDPICRAVDVGKPGRNTEERKSSRRSTRPSTRKPPKKTKYDDSEKLLGLIEELVQETSAWDASLFVDLKFKTMMEDSKSLIRIPSTKREKGSRSSRKLHYSFTYLEDIPEVDVLMSRFTSSGGGSYREQPDGTSMLFLVE